MRGFIIAFPEGYAPPSDWAARLGLNPHDPPTFAQVTVLGKGGKEPKHGGGFNLWCVVPPLVATAGGDEGVYVDALLKGVLGLFDYPPGHDVTIVGPFDDPMFNEAMAAAVLDTTATSPPAKA